MGEALRCWGSSQQTAQLRSSLTSLALVAVRPPGSMSGPKPWLFFSVGLGILMSGRLFFSTILALVYSSLVKDPAEYRSSACLQSIPQSILPLQTPKVSCRVYCPDCLHQENQSSILAVPILQSVPQSIPGDTRECPRQELLLKLQWKAVCNVPPRPHVLIPASPAHQVCSSESKPPTNSFLLVGVGQSM